MIGVDEVGRGCWAGPLLVVAALSDNSLPKGIIDSKLLNRIQREKLISILMKLCQFGEGWVSSNEIDKLGLSKSLRLGGQRALRALQINNSEAMVLDGKFNYLPKSFTKVTNKIKADNNYPIVSAASIYAKVRRDNFMRLVGLCYPTYKFQNHVGYGTRLHKIALSQYGPIKNIHRYSFKPVKLATGI